MPNKQISLLDPRAKTKAGAAYSSIVVGRADYAGALTCEQPWSPMLYSTNRRHSGQYQACTVMAYDVDNSEGRAPLTLERAKQLLISAGVACSLTTTASHQVNKNSEGPRDRFRLVVFLSEPVDLDSYAATWTDVACRLGIQESVDEAAKDAARYYAASTSVYYEQDGRTFEPVYYVEPPEPARQHVSAPAASAASRGSPSNKTARFLAGFWNDGEWHMRYIAAAMDLKEQGYSEDEAEELLSRASHQGILDKTDLQQLRDVYRNDRGGDLAKRIAWPRMLPLTERRPTAQPDPASIENLRYMLTDVLSIKLKKNVRNGLLYIQYPDDAKPRQIQDDDFSSLATRAREFRLTAGEALRDLINDLAKEAAYDPLLDSFNTLAWDGEPRIGALFDSIKLAETVAPDDKTWYALMLRRWLIGAVRKVYEPGSENNVLVFQGPQAAGKSRWLKKLAQIWPEGWGEGHVSPDDKDHELRHLDNFIWHVAEFDSTTSRREVGALKDYFTKDTVNVRRPYSRTPIIGRSVCSFCASVNSHDFLQDSTGNRRYLVIPVERLEVDHGLDMLQIMAEAKAAYQQGERQWFDLKEIAAINDLNSSYMSKEEFLEELELRVQPGEDKMSIQAIIDALGYGDVQLNKGARSSVRSILALKKIETRKIGGVVRFLINAPALRNTKPVSLTKTIA